MRWVQIATVASLSIASLAITLCVAPAHAEEAALPRHAWSFGGLFGTFDRAAAQRGFQVYREKCSTCHSLKHAYYRDLEGIGLSEEQIKSVAASVTVADTDDDGQPNERPAVPSDHFRAPFANEKAARAANNGALPPDLSLIIKARDGGADYINALLTGYSEPPAGTAMGDGMNYNKYFPGHQIAMAGPLIEGMLTYGDGTPASVNQMAHDITTFLAYVSEPETEMRKAMGVKIVLFFLVMTVVTYRVKRKIWSDVEH